MPVSTESKRNRACAALMKQVRAILDGEGPTPSSLHAIKLKLVALAKRAELFPLSDFEMPVCWRKTTATGCI